MMSAWEYVLNTAMLGTDKQGAGKQASTEDLAEVFELIDNAPEGDKESRFLNKAAVIFNYRQCGFMPQKKADLPLNIALPEIRPYCSEKVSNVLNVIIQENNSSLLETWLQLCDNKQQLALPDLLPELLEKAAQNALLRPLVASCSGNRGQWMSQFNAAWNYFAELPGEEIWQTGKPEDRVKVLKELRRTSPDKAREWLQQTWEQENAAAKAELLKCLQVNIGPGDLSWLETLLAEKGQKVKDEVIGLLKKVPGSSIVRQYEQLLGQSVTLKKEKALLGMMNKISIQIKLPAAIDESIFKSGIEKLSGPKSSLSDEQFIIYQVIGFVHPQFWEKQFNASPQQVVEYFEKYAPMMAPALGLAVAHFNEKHWAPYFLHQEGFYIDFINMVPAGEADKYLLRFMRKEGKEIIHYALQSHNEWSTELALTALHLMADYPYEYNSAFFGKHIWLIPLSVISQLEKIDPKNANLEAAWGKSKAQLLKLLNLKQQIIQAFNA